MKKIIIPKKKLLSNTSRRRTIKELLAKPEVGKVLNTRDEKRYFKEEIGKFAQGGIQKQEIRSMLADMKYNSDGVILEKEANKLIHAFGFKPRHVKRSHVPSDTQEKPVKVHEKPMSDEFKEKHYGFLVKDAPSDDLQAASGKPKPSSHGPRPSIASHLH